MKVKKEEIKRWINDVYTKLWTLLSMYEETDGFKTVPKGEAEEDPQDFINRKIGEIRRIEQNFSLYMDEQEIAEVKKSVPKLMVLDPGLLTIDPEVREVSDKLHQIVEETAYFVRQYEVPGVVKRWEMINPQLTYFDCAFDLMENSPKAYMEMKLRAKILVNQAHNMEMRKALGDGCLRLSNYPSAEMAAKRNAYFEKIKERNERENLKWSEKRIFQEELLNTLKLLFEDALLITG